MLADRSPGRSRKYAEGTNSEDLLTAIIAKNLGSLIIRVDSSSFVVPIFSPLSGLNSRRNHPWLPAGAGLLVSAPRHG